ncbi:hypothetical protein EVAR_51096_1 [Eumeta japonica]|uniref:Uncharacterized protein n=1 Tax=Eumeta variegata TaxID=151549 RepID=A0A4C1XJJ7_EUMVA|nr:hypothetical protein EVAR_51096_1 [Eumeta japonica]
MDSLIREGLVNWSSSVGEVQSMPAGDGLLEQRARFTPIRVTELRLAANWKSMWKPYRRYACIVRVVLVLNSKSSRRSLIEHSYVSSHIIQWTDGIR